MGAKKIARIRAMCEADPSNAFAWYSLAMAQKESAPDAALEVFAKIRADFPNYLPNYYHYAQTLAAEGETDDARKLYTEGIVLAEKQGDAEDAEDKAAPAAKKKLVAGGYGDGYGEEDADAEKVGEKLSAAQRENIVQKAAEKAGEEEEAQSAHHNTKDGIGLEALGKLRGERCCSLRAA